jgi:hypothetical protein
MGITVALDILYGITASGICMTLWHLPRPKRKRAR